MLELYCYNKEGCLRCIRRKPVVQVYCAVCSQQFNKIKPEALRLSSGVNTTSTHVPCQPSSHRRSHILRLGVGNEIIKHASCLPATTC